MDVREALNQLELAAAAAGAALSKLEAGHQRQMLEGWVPVAGSKRFAEQWHRWLLESAEMWPDHEPDDQPDLHRLLIRWATVTPPVRRHKTGHGGIGRWTQNPAMSGDGLSG
jgi:hypothetical protein